MIMDCSLGALLVFAIGFVLRSIVFLPEFSSTIAGRVELSVPSNSWRRTQEGIYLFENGIDPYSGDLFHETPLCIIFFSSILKFGSLFANITFIIVEFSTTVALYMFARNLTEQMICNEQKRKSAAARSELVTFEAIHSVPVFVALAYTCNPFLIGSCIARTTTVFTNFLVASTLFSASKADVLFMRELALLLLSLASYQTLYMALLFPPLHVYLECVSRKRPYSFSLSSLLRDLAVFSAFCGGLLCVSAHFMGSWSFLRGVYGFLISSPDLTPNIGLFWYFFSEMFEQFRTFFVWIFFLNVCIYSLPVTIKLRKDPAFALLLVILLITVFKPYPSYGEIGFYLSLLPIWNHLLPHMRQKLVVSIMMVTATVVFPVLWKLWIDMGSANANFVYALTLVFVSSQVFLANDLFIAHEKRDWHLENGPEVKNSKGEPAHLGLE